MDFCNMYSDGERERRANYLLGLVGIAEQANKLPSALSGGEQQRVAIARALANNPPLIIADEPTGNLDSKTASLIFNLFQDLVRQGKTVLMVTHDKELARLVPHKIEIADGRINGNHSS
jgi:putative ABC transport system ATP-binding protein